TGTRDSTSVGSPTSAPARSRSCTTSSGRRRKPTAPIANRSAKKRSVQASFRSARLRGRASATSETATAKSGSSVHEYLERARPRGVRDGHERVVERIHRVDEGRNRDAALGERGERRSEPPAARAEDRHLVDHRGREIEAVL